MLAPAIVRMRNGWITIMMMNCMIVPIMSMVMRVRAVVRVIRMIMRASSESDAKPPRKET